MRRMVESIAPPVQMISAYSMPLVLIASLSVNVLQARLLRDADRLSRNTPKIGASIGPLKMRTVAGTEVELAFARSPVPTILYYFSPSCRWCERNWKNVSALAASTRPRYRFVAIGSATDVRSVMERHALDFEIYGGLTAADQRAIGLGGTPHTIVVSPDGRVLISWVGAFAPRLQSEVERYFGVTLPGLSTPQADDRSGRDARQTEQ